MTFENFHSDVCPISFDGDELLILDQRKLPHEIDWVSCTDYESVAVAIQDMLIRGAPAIGIAAAYGVVYGLQKHLESGVAIETVFDRLANTRPTAVNLFWALDRMRGVIGDVVDSETVKRAKQEADAIFNEDLANNQRMAEIGVTLFSENVKILTHCNTGGLATSGYGTALGIIRGLNHVGKLKHVWVDETRPYLQGARLTTWECLQDNLPCTLITDSMAGHFMQRGEVDAVIVGTDRVAANGDVANKIGTYSLAVLCKHHGIPFYVAAPVSTIDMQTPTGKEIDIEQRSAEEVTHVRGQSIAPSNVAVSHPAFDVTPADLVTAIVTEDGIVRAPYGEALTKLLS